MKPMVKGKSFGERARLEVKGCTPELFLNECLKREVNIISAVKRDEFSLEITLRASDAKSVIAMAEKNGYAVEILDGARAGKYLLGKRIFPFLLAVCLLSVLIYSKLFLWEIDIKGNENISDCEILSALKDCGVYTGAFWPNFYAEDIRSEVLAKLPELSWITINIRGSVGEVICVERREKPEMVFEGEASHIVADKEAFVLELHTLVGKGLVERGEIIKKGEILISGAMESSFAPPRFVKSQGSIIAETNSEYIALSPKNMLIREYEGKAKHYFSIIIGNNRINFYSNSSISGGNCDKIISVWNAEIPGLMSLPISVIRETQMPYSISVSPREAYDARISLEASLGDYLAHAIGDGEIISVKINISSSEELYTASLRARCIEKIGISKVIDQGEKDSYIEKYNMKADE